MKNPIFDLVAVGAELERQQRYPNLTKAIRLAVGVGSAHQDIGQAVDSLETLITLTRGPIKLLSEEHRGPVAGALFTAAVIYYARGTDTDPANGRVKWFGVQKLEAAHRGTHKEIMTLRNKQVAHFGDGIRLDNEDSVLEALVYRPLDRQYGIGYVAARAQNKALFTRRFLALAKDVLALAERSATERFGEVIALIEDAADPQLHALIASFPVTNTRLIALDGRSEIDWTKAPLPRRITATGVTLVHDPE